MGVGRISNDYRCELSMEVINDRKREGFAPSYELSKMTFPNSYGILCTVHDVVQKMPENSRIDDTAGLSKKDARRIVLIPE